MTIFNSYVKVPKGTKWGPPPSCSTVTRLAELGSRWPCAEKVGAWKYSKCWLNTRGSCVYIYIMIYIYIQYMYIPGFHYIHIYSYIIYIIIYTINLD